MRKSSIFLIAFLSLCSCATVQRTDVFFGMNIPGGGEVSGDQWKSFNDSLVSPRFPNGYTEYQTAGKWLDTESRQTISENTRVLVFIGEKSRAREVALDTIIDAYIKRFRQQAVLRVDTKARFRLISSK